MSSLGLVPYSLTSTGMAVVCLVHAWVHTEGGEEFVRFIFRSKLSVATIANMALCVLLLVSHVVQRIFLGRLSTQESALLKEALLNFALFKVMFVAAMLEHEMGELVAWLVWFSVLAVFKLLSLAAHQRFIHLITVSPFDMHWGPLALATLMFVCNMAWAAWALQVLGVNKLSTVLLLCFESLCVMVEGLNTLARFLIHWLDVRRRGSWEEKGEWVYRVGFVCDSTILVATLLHYAQILFILGISFTLIDVVLLFNMRMVGYALLNKVRAYKTFSEMQEELKLRYPTVEIGPEDDEELCPICRESMSQAKRMPCQHLFHLQCIQSWLQNNQNSCPMCRYDLRAGLENRPRAAAAAQPVGWFARWFPSAAAPVLEESIDEIRDIFPHVNRQVIAEELQRSNGSIEVAIERLLNRI